MLSITVPIRHSRTEEMTIGWVHSPPDTLGFGDVTSKRLILRATVLFGSSLTQHQCRASVLFPHYTVSLVKDHKSLQGRTRQ